MNMRACFGNLFPKICYFSLINTKGFQMKFITFFLQISKDSNRPYYTPARWVNGLTVPGKKKGTTITLSSVENDKNGRDLPEGTPSAILPDVDADASNLPEKISWDVAARKTVALREQS